MSFVLKQSSSEVRILGDSQLSSEMLRTSVGAMGSGTSFYSKPVGGLPCFPADSEAPLTALHTPINLLPCHTSDFICISFYHLINIDLKAHWFGLKNTEQVQALVFLPLCLAGTGKVIYSLCTFISSTVRWVGWVRQEEPLRVPCWVRIWGCFQSSHKRTFNAVPVRDVGESSDNKPP